MRTKLMILFVIALVIIGINSNLIAASELASKTMAVRVNIPVVQKLEVIDTVVVDDVRDEFDRQEDGQAVVIENAGVVKIISNDHWRLELNNVVYGANYDVFVRVDRIPGWQNISQGTGYINGTNGRQLLSFDLKIVANTTDVSNITGGVQLGFTLGQS